MAGRRWFARNFVASMGWWCLIIAAIGGCCGVLAADSAAMKPNSAVSREEEGGCYRPLSDVIWGFLVDLLALTVSFWGSWRHRGDDTAHVCGMILAGLFAPLEDLVQIISKSLQCVSLLWNCHKMEYPNSRITSHSWLKFLCTSLFPWSKFPVRILASCDIVVYVSKESPLLEKKWLWKPESYVTDESEAMVVGENGARAIRNDQYVRKELSEKGLGLLVWKEVFCKAQDTKRLPKYDELKYLRGDSGFTIIAIAMQALGYIYGVGFRVAKNLQISPLEVIGLVFNIILLIKMFFYVTCNRCYRPLVIYMDRDWEHEVGEFNDNDRKKLVLYDSRKILAYIIFGIFVGLNVLLIYCIVYIVKATHVMVVLSTIFFLIGIDLEFLGILFIKIDQNNEYIRGASIIVVACLVNGVAYIWALVGTLLYWKTMHFNTRADLINLSQIIPFIG